MGVVGLELTRDSDRNLKSPQIAVAMSTLERMDGYG